MAFSQVSKDWTAYTKETKKLRDKSKASDAEGVAGSIARVEGGLDSVEKASDELLKKLTSLGMSLNQLKKDAADYRRDHGIPERPKELDDLDDAVKDLLKEVDKFKDAVKEGQKGVGAA